MRGTITLQQADRRRTRNLHIDGRDRRRQRGKIPHQQKPAQRRRRVRKTPCRRAGRNPARYASNTSARKKSGKEKDRCRQSHRHYENGVERVKFAEVTMSPYRRQSPQTRTARGRRPRGPGRVAPVMPPAGLEPATHCLEGSRSLLLSYGGRRIPGRDGGMCPWILRAPSAGARNFANPKIQR